ncbi:MAG: cytochrome c oxidase subunit II, partial [Methylophilaceae bacterium]|nr:cytochrome c oxidase subunit II [Methylophilaceae bacterium]
MGVKQFLKLLSVGLMSAFYSVIAHAEYAWNFPAPATPMAADTLHVHNEFMLIVGVIFVVVLGIMIYSIVNHRKSKGYKPSKFTGPANKR